MRLNDVIEDLIYDAPLAFVYLGGGLILWFRRDRAGPAGTTTALTLFTLCALHALWSIATRFLLDAMNARTRPSAETYELLRLAFSTLRASRQIMVAVGLLVLARCALAGRPRWV